MISVRKLTLQDKALFPEGLELLNRTQGRDLFAPDYLLHTVQDLKSYVVGGFQSGDLIAVGVAAVIEDFNYYVPFQPGITAELKDLVVGSFSTLCVREDLQGKGVGQLLSQARLDWLVAQGCQVILGISWVSGKAHTSDRVFKKFGFQEVKMLPDFFKESSIKRPFICPGCHNQPCSCAAILYRKNL